MGLLPAELWEHKLSDVLASTADLFHSHGHIEGLEVPGIGSCVPVRSARAAIFIALRSLGLEEGARVGVPLYSCPAVFKAVDAAGYRMTFVDVEPGTYCMSPEDLRTKKARMDAVIAVHMFGNMCDMNRILEAADGLPVIEDCAQSIGSEREGKPAGSFAQAAAFSFRLGKYVSAGEGGALFAKDERLLSRFWDQIKQMEVSGPAAEIKHIATSYARALLRSRPLYGIVGDRLWKAYNARVEYSGKTQVIVGPMFYSDILVARRRLKQLKDAILRQRANSDFYLSNLRLPKQMLVEEKQGTFLNRYLFPIALPSTRHRDYLAGFLFQKKIGTLKPYKDISEVASRYYGYEGDCRAAERAAALLLAIPVHHSVRESEICRVAEYVNEGWQSARRALGE
jgi:perosamine synthetase